MHNAERPTLRVSFAMRGVWGMFAPRWLLKPLKHASIIDKCHRPSAEEFMGSQNGGALPNGGGEPLGFCLR